MTEHTHISEGRPTPAPGHFTVEPYGVTARELARIPLEEAWYSAHAERQVDGTGPGEPAAPELGRRLEQARLALRHTWTVPVTHPTGWTFGKRSPSEVVAASEARAGDHQPTVLDVDLRCGHYRVACSCVGSLLFRGACLGCPWEGPIRFDGNEAVEDAHDHTHPGWRDLPIEPFRALAGRDGMDLSPREREKLRLRWALRYPPGWTERRGPVRTARHRFGTRHAPDQSPFGGYDLCGAVVADTTPKPPATQLDMFECAG